MGTGLYKNYGPLAYKRFKTFETVNDCEKWFIFPSDVSEMREPMKIRN
jgi:hypothetical protein